MEKELKNLRVLLKKKSDRAVLSYNTTIRLVAFLFVTTQIISVLRATGIYNTSYIGNFLRLFLSSIYIALFAASYAKGKRSFTFYETIFVLIPIIGLFVGYINTQFGRDYFSDFFNAIAFAFVIVHYRRDPQSITKDDLEYLAKWEFAGALISFLIYKLFPLFGYPILSVGIVSNSLLFPLSYFLAYKKKWWIAVSIAILFGGKRGVMISAVALLCYFFVFDKRRSIRAIIAVIFAGVIVSAGLYFTESPEHIALLPTSFERVALRFMRVNPFSDYYDPHSDGRLDEIESALNSFDLNPMNIIFGRGNGFTYDVYHNGVLRFSDNHNVHFTPVSFLTRYGIIYTAVFYINYLWMLFKSTKRIRRDPNHQFIMCITLYLVGTFVDQLTAFLPYTDYLFMICFGLMNGILLCNCDFREEGILYDRAFA